LPCAAHDVKSFLPIAALPPWQIADVPAARKTNEAFHGSRHYNGRNGATHQRGERSYERRHPNPAGWERHLNDAEDVVEAIEGQTTLTRWETY
jgi:hypothetical protein